MISVEIILVIVKLHKYFLMNNEFHSIWWYERRTKILFLQINDHE